MRPFILVVSLMALAATSANARQSIEPIEMNVEMIDDSLSYFVYRYVVVNPVGSSNGVATLVLDVNSWTNETLLPATGPFQHARDGSVGLPLVDNVGVGPISPTNWQAYLSRDAMLYWFGTTNGGFLDLDTIAPGDTLSGVGMRSTYLPGVREIRANPTWQSCCSAPWGTVGDNPDRFHRDPSEFAAASWTIGPTFAPEEITTEHLVFQIEVVCDEPLWIDDEPLCSELSDSLTRVIDLEGESEFVEAVAVVLGMIEIVDGERAGIHPNAYWLLTLNLGQLAENIGGPEQAPMGASNTPIVRSSTSVAFGRLFSDAYDRPPPASSP